MSGDWLRAEIEGHVFEIDLADGQIHVDGRSVEASIQPVGEGTFSLIIDGRSTEVTIEPEGDSLRVTANGKELEVELLSRLDVMIRESGKGSRNTGPSEVRSPMPGLVLKVEVSEGQTVTSGDGLIVLEAMKMENEIFAAADGIVERIHVKEGDAVMKSQVLVSFGQ